ncbi:flagellar biosynthetic protein FliO [Caproiciproducens galactitolivorans]|uniref:Flagellar biosynthesis protein, FliO n=1 Tax=Caproiciproducens galactitolivorans TaxID=642589 RepID=A0A4Z0YML8_9FIRM|nr:flagellar biosynthetic protein FliO [Caproiciproducens galactitolivorans]QEY34331.1 flagellar biosynthetic protein FliO [Caproiciproducens galactitolivorans]TGJ77902.1 flagellar biosynthesis protein, FliO [Caproiciproducens galactitolivorans]
MKFLMVAVLPLLSFFSDILPLFFSLAAIILVLYLCSKFSQFMVKRVNNISNSNNMKVIERLALTQDKGLAIVEVCKKLYLIGFSSNSVEILKELDESEMHILETVPKDGFLETLNSTLKSGWDVKLSDAVFSKARKTDNAEDEKEQK